MVLKNQLWILECSVRRCCLWGDRCLISLTDFSIHKSFTESQKWWVLGTVDEETLAKFKFHFILEPKWLRRAFAGDFGVLSIQLRSKSSHWLVSLVSSCHKNECCPSMKCPYLRWRNATEIQMWLYSQDQNGSKEPVFDDLEKRCCSNWEGLL